MSDVSTRLLEILRRDEAEILDEWISEQTSTFQNRSDLIQAAALKTQCNEFLNLFRAAILSGNISDIRTANWEPVRDMLSGVSRSRALNGFTPSETATFIFSLKKPLFVRLQQEFISDPVTLASVLWAMMDLMDKLGLFTTEAFQRSREEVISRQQDEILELSTPVVKLWDGVLAVPLIGTLDSSRTQVVMESLLQTIVDTGSELAVIDITGVPTVDTLTAQHLLKTVAAARLMGADCIISGIRPQIAQTIVHLGVDLSAVTTKASLADAFKLALQRTGYAVTRAKG